MTEPSNTGMKFLLYGEITLNQEKKGLVVSIDFTNLFENKCQGVENPGENDSDYEIWTPHSKFS